MTAASPLSALRHELSEADPGLVGNEDLLRGVLAGCGDCIKILDLDGRLQFMSEGGKRVMEVEDFSQLKGCPWPSFWAGEGNLEAIKAVEAAKSGETARFMGAANTAKGTPRYWEVQVSPILGANGKVAQLLSISKDVTEQWEAAERARFLAEELEHRTKNTFAMVLAIASQTFRDGVHAAPLQLYSTRVTALAKAHGFAKANTLVRAVVEAVLSPYRTGEGRFKISGSDVMLNSRQALSLTLAINELATNATKYGALSAPNGKIDIEWSKTDAAEPQFVFTWREHGGHPTVAPTRQGFGTRVIRDFMAADFGGDVQLTFEPTGVVCRLTAPLENLPA